MSFGSKGEQLKMFMTPREIHAEYQPLDADREDRYDDPERSYGTPLPTARSTGSTDRTGRTEHYQYREGYDTEGSYQATTHGTKWRGGEHEETDEELWDRKLEESQYEHHVPGRETEYEYPVHHHGGGTSTADLSSTAQGERVWAGRTSGGRNWRSYETEGTPMVSRPGTPSMSLYDSIQFEGVKSPIRLGETIGSMGKKEIVGGHHRLASQTDIDPNALVPVLHHTDIFEAKTNPSYKYT